MTPPQQHHTRDPVCGMAVDPSSAKYSAERNGVIWYFCAAGCRNEFLENPERFAAVATALPQPAAKRTSLGREMLWAAASFLVVIMLVMVGRGITIRKSPVGTNSNSIVIGKTAGQDQAVDDGSGGVITTASYDRHSAKGEAVFTLSLNTHTVDLSGFNPIQQVHLRDATTELHAQGFEIIGERSSHHQEYYVEFPNPQVGQTTLVVTDLAGVSERQLSFNP